MGNQILISDGVTPTWFGENSDYILDSWLTKFTPDLVDLGLPDDLQFVQYTDTTGALVSSSTDYVLPLTVDTEINTRDDLVWWEIHPDVQSGFVINGFNNVDPVTQTLLTDKFGVTIQYHYYPNDAEFAASLDYFFPQSDTFKNVSDVLPTDIGLINIWNQYEYWDGSGVFDHVEMGYLIPTGSDGQPDWSQRINVIIEDGVKSVYDACLLYTSDAADE